MTAQCIDGRSLARAHQDQLARQVGNMPHDQMRPLHIIVAGSDAVRDRFVRIKAQVAERIGIPVQLYQLTSDATDTVITELQDYIRNSDGGVIIQLPLPHIYDRQRILDCVPVHRDVDLLSQSAHHQWLQSNVAIMPPVAYAVRTCLQSVLGSDIVTALRDQHIAVIGDGALVGRPVREWLDQLHISYSGIDIATAHDDRIRILQSAGVIISGTGVAHGIPVADISPNTILIDCGTSEQSGQLCGDIHPDCYATARAYTPVPGGIGPLTVIGVLANHIALLQDHQS